MTRRSDPFWTKVFFRDFIKHFRKLSDEQIVADVRRSMDDLDDLVADSDSFGSAMVRSSQVRMERNREIGTANGSKGGRPANVAEPELMPARPVASRTAVRVADPVVRETFEVFRKAYRGQKNGLESELQVFLKACAKFGYNPAEEVGRLLPAWDSENRARVSAGLDGAFFPQVKNLKTWLGNACWLQDLPAADPVKNLTQGERIILKNRLKEGTNA